MGKYSISKKAVADLDDIWNYTVEHWSEEQANKYYRQIALSIQCLSDLPEFSVQDYNAIKPGLFGYHVSHHIIFFKRKEDGNIWVDRILHEMMDFQRHFD